MNTSDNCKYIPNPTQKDENNNGKGDACETDEDGDGQVNKLKLLRFHLNTFH